MMGLEAGPQAGYLLLKILSAVVLIKFWAGYWKVRRQSNDQRERTP